MTQNPSLFTVIETPVFTRLADQVIHLLLIHAKGVRDKIDAKTLERIRRTLDGEDD